MYHNMLGFVPLRVFTSSAPDGFILSIFSQQNGLYCHHLTHYVRRSGEASMADPEALALYLVTALLDGLDNFYHPDDPRERFWHRNPEVAAGDVLTLFRTAI